MKEYSVVCPVQSETIKKIIDNLKQSIYISEYYEIVSPESLCVPFIYLLEGNTQQNINTFIKELEKAFSYIDEFLATPHNLSIYINQLIGINISIDNEVLLQIFHKLRMEACKYLKIDRGELRFQIFLAKSKKEATVEKYHLCKEELVEIYKKNNTINILCTKPVLCATHDKIKNVYLS